MNARPASLRVLLVEDSEHDAELVLRRLRRAGVQVTAKRVASEGALRGALRGGADYDVAIVDYTLPGLDAPRALEMLGELASDLPCVVVSGTVGEELAVRTVQLGAADYLLKDRLARLPSAVLNAIERSRAGRALRERERRLQAILDHAPAIIFLKDPEGRYLVVNREFHRMLPDPSLEVAGRTDAELFAPKQAAVFRANDKRIAERDEAMRFEEQWIARDGEHTSVVVKFPLRDDTGKMYATGGVATDISDLKRAQREAQLLRDAALALGRGAGLTESLTGVLRSVCEATGWNCAQAWLRSADGGGLECSKAWYGSGPAAERFRAASLLVSSEALRLCIGDVLGSGLPAHSVDLGTERRFSRRAEARDAGFNAWTAFPVAAEGEVIAVLEFFASEAAVHGAEMVELVSLVCSQLGATISQRRSAEERDRLFRLSGDLLYIATLSGILVQLNPAWESVLGWRAATLRGTAWRDLLHPNDSARAAREYERLREGETVLGLETRLRRADGAYRWIEWSAIPSRETSLVYAIGRDVTRNKETEERFRATFNQAAVGIAHTGFDGRFLRVNDKLCEIVGCTRDELLGLGFTAFTHPEDMGKSWLQLVQRDKQSEEAVHFEKRYLRKDGATSWLAVTSSVARGPSGEAEYFIAVIQDVTNRKRIEQSQREAEERYRSLVEQSPDAIVLLSGGRVTFVNRAGVALIGANAPDKIVGRRAEEFVHPDFRPAVLERMEQLAVSGGALPAMRQKYLRLDGSAVDVEVVPRAMTFDGEPTIQLVARDISERIRSEARIEYLATHDDLTGLPNRNVLVDRLGQAIPHARRAGQLLAVALLDVDNFKLVNDSFGHPFGDILLREIAQQLSGAPRGGDTVARVGGDEFVILLTDLAKTEDIALALEKVQAAFRHPFRIDGRELVASASIGVSVFPDDGETLDVLLRNADVAMYRAKEEGRNTLRFFTREMGARALERVETEAALRRAIERREFVLHFQPKAALREGRIVGAEALVRWNDPARGTIAPGAFIPVAEETGLIVPIGQWVLEQACLEAAAWAAEGHGDLRVAVNVSVRQFRQSDFARQVERALREARLDPASLELEVTESMIMDSAESFVSTLHDLRALGVGLSIDDFGTGYSSLSYLKRFPIDSLKIDQSFVHDIPGDPEDAAIAQAVIDLGHSLELTVIAEGVETREQLEFLRQGGCDVVQGYYIGRPQPAAQFVGLLRESPYAAVLRGASENS